MSLIDGLSAYWKLDEASGSRADSVGANTLTDNNTVLAGTGKHNNAADFESANSESLSITDNTALSTGDIDFCISMWVNPESITANHVLACKLDSDAVGEWQMVMRSTGTIDFQIFNAGSGKGTATSAAISTGVWTHVVGYHDSVNNVVGIVLNAGTPVTTATTGAPADTTTAFRLGSYTNNVAYYDGLMDEVAFWRKILTAGELAVLYNNRLGLPYPFITGNIPSLGLMGVGA